MQHTGEGSEVSLRVLGFAIRRVEEYCRRRPRAGKRPLVTNVCPQSSRRGPAAAGRQYRHRRVVAIERLQGHHLGGQYFDQRGQCRRRGADPARQGRGLQVDTLARIDLGLAIKRQMIVVLRDNDVRR
jgi:hypothetical protein